MSPFYIIRIPWENVASQPSQMAAYNAVQNAENFNPENREHQCYICNIGVPYSQTERCK